MSFFSKNLNPQQLQAVNHWDGPLMVVAGAGSGKTRVITCRIASLIHERDVNPDAILAITFTNKAANEMLGRVRELLGSRDTLWISTFHAFCLSILRRHADRLSFRTDFAIYDRQDQLSLLKRCMKNLDITEDVFPPKTILQNISGFKNDLLLPEDIDLKGFGYDVKMKAAEIYPIYQKNLADSQAMDFDDLLVYTVRLLQKDLDISDFYNGRFKHLLVDEFQDTNAVQYKLVRLLTQRHKNICVVGDDDQSIYRWRGADIANILNFEKDYPGTVIVKLEENYRSTKNILKAASAVVVENKHRKAKTLWTGNEPGEPVYYIHAEDETDEAETAISEAVKLHQEEGIPLSEIAVLYRTNAQSRSVEDALRKQQIPYQVVGGLRFYERKEIKDILAYMRVAINPEDSVSLRRIVNLPARGIGKTSLEKLESHANKNRITLYESMLRVKDKNFLGSGPTHKVVLFVAMMEKFKEVCASCQANDFLKEILERSGYMKMLDNDASPESRSRIENINELYAAIEQFVDREKNNNLRDFLDTTTLASDADQYDNTQGLLHLMTLHTCKGLEFKAVFIIGMENRILPHVNSMASPEEYEEERRLCYVGFTRAKKKLFLTNAKHRRIFGSLSSNNPSDFLESVPPDLIVQIASLAEDSQIEEFEKSPSYFNESSKQAMPHPKNSLVSFALGSKVIHPKFGSGVIIRRDGNEDNLKLVVFFKQAGKKTLAKKYANLIEL